jgi:HD superfamily phosphohydrolase
LFLFVILCHATGSEKRVGVLAGYNSFVTIHDSIYGSFEITSPVVLELISTPEFQRLKNISQFGVPDEYYHLVGYSRYEHSLGVYILLHRLGASEEEQVAGLLHDISHTAFSHLIDWVIGDSKKEDYQDTRHLSVLQQSDIADILKKYSYTPAGIAEYHRFTLLEQDSPKLCADRIDYVLRESDQKIAQACLPKLTVTNNRIVFATQESARIFANNFLNRQIHHWASYEAVTRYMLFADVLKNALQKKLVSVDDFFQDEKHVMAKILNTKNTELLKSLEILKNKDLSGLPKADTRVKKKFRYVDPEFLDGEKAARLSEVDSEFKKRVEKAKEENEMGVLVGVVKE